MRKEVSYAKLHGTDAFIPGIGGVGTTLPPTGKTLNLKMFYTPEGLEWHAGLPGKQRQSGIIPLANIQIVVYTESQAAASAVTSEASKSA